MKIERLITVFDNTTDLLESEINIDYIDLEQLKRIFNPPSEDPLMYFIYEIKPDNVQLISVLLKDDIVFDFKAKSYSVECVQLPPQDFG